MGAFPIGFEHLRNALAVGEDLGSLPSAEASIDDALAEAIEPARVDGIAQQLHGIHREKLNLSSRPRLRARDLEKVVDQTLHPRSRRGRWPPQAWRSIAARRSSPSGSWKDLRGELDGVQRVLEVAARPRP